MLSKNRLLLQIIIPALLLVLGGLSAGYLYRQISRAQADFPPARPAPALSADKGYGTTIDLARYPETELYRHLETIQSARLTWLRVPFRWAELEPQPGEYRWEATDQAVQVARAYGFKLIAVIDTSPEWARAAGAPPTTPPLEPTDLGHFARVLAARYGADITHYQIWHEPNLSAHWGNRYVDAAGYTLLLKNAAMNIRAVQPQAKIIAAAPAPTVETGPLNLNEAAYLQAMYQAGAAPWFDIAAGELYGFADDVEPVAANAQAMNFHRVTLLRQVMEANGDAGKPVWATAFGWNVLPEGWPGPAVWYAATPEKQAARTGAGLDFARANWPWLGPILAAQWDGTGLAPDDPARGFAISSPIMLAPFEAAARAQIYTATVGSYPATHPGGQYSPGWGYGPDTTDIPRPASNDSPPTLTLPFAGTRLDLQINRGPYQGYLYVTIDGGPANALPTDTQGRSFVVLNDPLRASASVPLAEHLPDGEHTAVITAAGGWGQWAISGWRVHRQADTRTGQRGLALSLLAAGLGGLGLAWQAWQHRLGLGQKILWWWDKLARNYARLGNNGQIGLTFGLAALFWFLPGPLALLTLPLLGLAFLLRLETGLLLISFGLSFFLAKKSVGGLTLPAFELALVMLIPAYLIRLFWPRLSHKTAPAKDLLSFTWLTWGDGAALALPVLAILTTITAPNPGTALYELRTVVLGSVAFYFLIRLLARLETVARPDFSRRLVDAFVAGAVLHALTALFQYCFNPAQTITAEGVHRALGYLYGSPNNLSLFLERAIPLLVVVALFGAGKTRRMLYGAGLLITGAALFLTYSKGSLLLAMPAMALFFALMKGGKRAWLGAGSGLILLAVALIPLVRTERFRQTFSLEPGSTGFARLKLWQSAWQMIKDRPLTGLGLDNFLYEYRTRYILPEAWAEPNLSHPHNLILDFGTRLGLGGIALLAWWQGRFWVQAMRGYFKQPNTPTGILLLGLMGSMITFLAHGLVDNSYFLVDLAGAFFLAFGLTEELAQTTDEPI